MRILIVEDEQDYGEALRMVLEGKGYVTDICANGEAALARLEKHHFDLVITDLRMPVMDGMQLLKEMKKRELDGEVILLTAYGTVRQAVDAMKIGAATYVTKGEDPAELLLEIEKIKEAKTMGLRHQILKEKNGRHYMLESKNPAYRQMLHLAERAAESNANILITGESGVGKEVLAYFLHQKSPRKAGDFMEVNCQAISESLLESELFGHEKGAFTGAEKKRIGVFEAAGGGTLFLDEIGGISLQLQAKLLKALEDHVIYRLGSSIPIHVDFRLITATNRDLRQDMQAGTFREDLFYRISTIVLEHPPLRERREDIPLLLHYFIQKYAGEMNKKITDVEVRLQDILKTYHYPGNVRELKNIAERLVVFAEGGQIKQHGLPDNMATGGSGEVDAGVSLRAYRSKLEKDYIAHLLDKYANDMNKVAQTLEITRRQLFNKVAEYDLKKR